MSKINWKFWVKKPPPIVRKLHTNITSNIGTPQQKFCSNAIISSRYTWYNFVPKNVFEQFHNLANIFFTIIAILYMFAEASTSIWANLGPLIAIIFLTAVKDGIEDILRHRRDATLNKEVYQVLDFYRYTQQFAWTETRAKSLRVGDIVFCERDRSFPCDLIVLASDNSSTELNVTTSNLDGETNIKKYFAVDCTQQIYRPLAPHQIEQINSTSENFDEILDNLKVEIECQAPNENLNHFEGFVHHAANTTGRNIPLTSSNLVLRGAKLKNTNFIIGLVIYTGAETKLSLNGKQSQRKYSSRESRSNVILLAFIVTMFTMAIIFAIVFYCWTQQTRDGMWYLPIRKETTWYFIQNIFRFIFMLNYLIPISIIITIDLQQLVMAYLISSDARMYSPEADLRVKANSAQLADELGQIEFLFSDKTGTLTQNVMSLRFCGVLETESIYTFVPKLSELSGSQDGLSLDASISDSESSDDEDGYPTTPIEPEDMSSGDVYNQPDMKDPEFVKFLTMCALCHTVEVSHHDNQADEKKYASGMMYNYEASSPDEKALVEGAATQGVLFTGSAPVEGTISSKRYRLLHTVKANISDHSQRECGVLEKDYIVDAVLEFTSDRKRMTIMVRYSDGTCHIHSKGAESVMLDPKLCEVSSGAYRTLALQYANRFALQGYRTLVFSTRTLERNAYQELLDGLWRAQATIGADRNEAIEEASAEIESHMMPVFVSAVEDKLQNGVKECLHNLRSAGIQIWILTGDKEETAITISQSAGHFSPNMGLIRLTRCSNYENAACALFEQLEGLQTRGEQIPGLLPHRTSITATQEELDDVLLTALDEEVRNSVELPTENVVKGKLEQFRSRLVPFMDVKKKVVQRLIQSRRRRRRPGTGGEPIGLVIDGVTLRFLLDPTLHDAFLDLCMNVTTVLCCRMTPLQKASVVQLVQVGLSHTKDGFGAPVTAAIGDGGNDVAMLLQANVGVGIYGKEGLEAARAADYSIPEFRYLTQLFLMHGHWAYHRLSYTMNLFYFKCTLLVTTQVLLEFHSGFSQQVSFSSLLFALYNLTMTSLVYLLYGMFERHLSDEVLQCKPYLYRVISKQANLRSWYIPIWVLEGLWQGTVVYFTTYFALAGASTLSPAIFYDSGLDARASFEFEFVGIATYVMVWLCANVRIALQIRDLNFAFLIGFSITACNLIFFYATGVASFVGLFLSPSFWFTLLFSVILANLPAMIWRLLSDTWWTIQLMACDIPQAKMRKQFKRSKQLWMQALCKGRFDSTHLLNLSSSDEERGSKQTTVTVISKDLQLSNIPSQ